MTTRQISAARAALVLGATSAAACGDSGGDRENVDQSNQGELTAPGSESTIETGPTTLGATGETQPSVTQPEDGP